LNKFQNSKFNIFALLKLCIAIVTYQLKILVIVDHTKHQITVGSGS